jgi:hypothetical protein
MGCCVSKNLAAVVRCCRAVAGRPVISRLIWRGRDLRWLVGGILGYGILEWSGLPVWKCPFFAAVGIPCPGCGLTRALVALWHHDFALAWVIHPFSWIVAPVAIAALVAAALPRGQRIPLARRVASWERFWMPGWWFTVSLLGFWFYRLALDGFPSTILSKSLLRL